LLLRSLHQGVTDLRQNPPAWGRYLETTIAHPVGHRIPFFRRWFDLGPFQQSGTTTTVKQTTKRMAPSMRFIADLGDFDGSLHNLTTGQSGQPLAPHYKDQWTAYQEGRSFVLPFRSPKVTEVLNFAPASR